MASRDAKSDVLEFLDSYRSAFEAFDTEAIVAHFLFPCHIVSDAEDVSLMPLAKASEGRAGVERVLALHRELGVHSGRILDLDVVELSPRMAGMVLRYEFFERRPYRDHALAARNQASATRSAMPVILVRQSRPCWRPSGAHGCGRLCRRLPPASRLP